QDDLGASCRHERSRGPADPAGPARHDCDLPPEFLHSSKLALFRGAHAPRRGDQTRGMDEMTRLSLALTGDTIMQRHVSTCEDPAFLGAVDVVRSATAGFTNLEGCVQAGEDWHAFLAGNGRLATFVRSPAYIGDELTWMGFRLLSLTNNHAADYGEGGVLTALRYLKQWPDLVGAGIGATLAEASMPKYLDTPAGVVAIIAAADWGPRGMGDLAFPPPIGALAADADRYYKGRPGLNLLR